MSERDYRPDRVYGRTKLANILFTHELARRLEGSGVTANAVHPGVVATGLLSDYLGMPAGRRSFGTTPDRGAEPILYLAASPEVAGVSGRYFDRCTETRSSAASYDEAAARRLWEESCAGRTGSAGHLVAGPANLRHAHLLLPLQRLRHRELLHELVDVLGPPAEDCMLTGVVRS